MHKKRNAIVVLLSIGLGACFPSTDRLRNETCSELVTEDAASLPLARIFFEAPAGWVELRPGVWSESGATLLTIFVFDAGVSTAKGCVDTVLQVVSEQSLVNNVTFDASSLKIAGLPAVIAVADGISRTGNGTIFRGVYAGVSSGDWVYVFAWDAFGEVAASTVTQEAALILGSIVIR